MGVTAVVALVVIVTLAVVVVVEVRATLAFVHRRRLLFEIVLVGV